MKTLRQFTTETAFKIKLSKMHDVTFSHEPTGSTARLVGGDRATYLTDVHTPHGHRGKGGADGVMKKVTAHLDANGMRATLLPKPQDSSTKSGRLRALYAKHGFKLQPDGMMTREATRSA